jgi:hypothetical protein
MRMDTVGFKAENGRGRVWGRSGDGIGIAGLGIRNVGTHRTRMGMGGFGDESDELFPKVRF